MLWVIIGIIVAIGLISWATTGDATDVKGAAGVVKDGASSAAGTVGGAVTGAAGTVGGAVTGATSTVGGAVTGATSTVASAPAPPPPPPITYAKYNEKPYWDGGAKLTCPTAVGVNLTGNNKDYANYCIFTGTGAEANAQTACSSISNCVGYVVGTDSTGPMYQLTTMPKYDPGTTSHRFYVKKPLPTGVTLPSVAGFKNKYIKYRPPPPPPPRRPPHPHKRGFTSERPSLSNNPGYHNDIQAFGGDPTMNLV